MSRPLILALSLGILMARSADFLPQGPRCDWPVVQATQLSSNDFKNVYQNKLPLTIELDSAVAKKFGDGWAIAKLLERFGDFRVGATLLSDLQNTGAGEHDSRSVSACFDTNASAEPRSDEIPDRFCFLRGAPSIPAELHDAIAESCASLPFFSGYWGHGRQLVLSLGGVHNGIPLHFHGDSWLHVVEGAKYWALFAPGKLPGVGYSPGQPFYEWLRQHSANARAHAEMQAGQRDGMFECVQRPGTIVYVPQGWYHGTLNLEPTVGVGGQLDPTPEAWFDFSGIVGEIESGGFTAAISKAEERFDKTRDWLVAGLLGNLYLDAWGDSARQSKDYLKKAEAFIESAATLNPLSGTPHALYARLLAESRPKEWRAKAKTRIEKARELDSRDKLFFEVGFTPETLVELLRELASGEL